MKASDNDEKSQKLGWFARVAIGLGMAVLGLVAVVVAALVIENWRGASAWKSVQKAHQEAKDPLDLEAVIPPPVPADQNFANTALLKPLLEYRAGKKGPAFEEAQERLKELNLGSSKGAPERLPNGRLDLPAWQRHFASEPDFPHPTTPGTPADDVLLALGRWSQELKELATDAQKPQGRYNVHYDEGYMALLPHLAALKGIATIYEVRSGAYLEKGNSAAASQDIETVERLAQSLDSEPLLISMLVEFAVQSISSRMIWQGLVDHRWDEAQLAHFQDLFARRTDPLQRCLTSLRAERAFSASAIDDLIKDPRRESALASESGDWRNTVRFIPRGWLRQNQVSLAGYYDGVIHQLEQGGNMEQVLSAESSGRRYLEGRPRLYAMFANMLAAAIDKADTKSYRMQALNRMGQTACALERYRRTSGVYPETLDKLTPKYLASAIMDPASRKPFRYEPQGDEWYRLYSLGANSRDDGGKPSRDEKGGDWCWPEPVDMKPRLF